MALSLPFASTLAACGSSSRGSAAATTTAAATTQGAATQAATSAPPAPSSAAPAKLSMSKLNALTSFQLDPAFTADVMALSIMGSDHNVDVNQATLVGANTAVTALIAGQVDIIVSSLVAGVAAVAQGQEITAVFPGVMVPEHLIITNDKIQSWSDVAGKTFGVTSKTDSSYWELALLAEKHNVDINSIKIVTVKGSTARSAALASGKIDGAALSVGFAVKLLAQQPKLHQFALPGEEFPNLLFDCYFVHNSFLKDHADVVQAYAESMLKAQRAMFDKSTYLAQAAKFVGNGFTQAELDSAYDILLKLQVWDPNASRWNADAGNFTTNDLAKLKVLPNAVDFSKWATTKYTDAAVAKLGQFKQ